MRYFPRMANDTTFTLRLPSELKNEIAEIAEKQMRSTSMVFILLLRRGIELYRQDGMLLETQPKPSPQEKAAPAKKRSRQKQP